ncbi:hypothetical protein ACP70R_012425 [Stipagrostis hirtigluma subsp. patula]
MAVFFRYRSGVETFSVPVAAPSVSVADLKRLIMGTARHGHGRTRGRGPKESVALSDARTGEEYADDSALIPRNSTVVVRRVAGPPAETITVASSPPPPPPKATSSTSAEDDEARAISAVIDAAQLKWEDHPYSQSQGGRCYGRRGAHEQRAPPAGYVCHRCRVAGHFIQHCPTNGDPRFDFGRASPTSTAPPAPAPAPASPDDGVPAELHCKICKKVMADAVVTSRCCFDSFCDGCIRAHIAARSRCVCGAQARGDDLIPNLTLRATIANVMAARAAGSASDKTRSSAGSNAAPASQSPAASQGSRGHVTPAGACSEHSDGSASSTTTTKRAGVAAPRGPRTMEQEAAAEPAETIAPAAGYPRQYDGYGGPYGPACYDPFFGAAPWAHDPYMYYGVPYGGGYPVGPYGVIATGDAPAPECYHGGRQGRKRTVAAEDRGRDETGLKRRCGRRLVAI